MRIENEKNGGGVKKVGVGDVDLGARFVFLLNYAKAVPLTLRRINLYSSVFLTFIA